MLEKNYGSWGSPFFFSKEINNFGQIAKLQNVQLF